VSVAPTAPVPGIPTAKEVAPATRVPGLGMTIISPRTQIRGRLAGDGSLLVQGRVDGEIAIGGGLVVADTGTIEADVQAPVIEVAGAARGSIVASIRVSVESTGTVEGTLTTPILDLKPGSVLRGRARIAGVPARDRRGLSH
jgi:cytoskeletal protein CcmA (bactofilin family)